MSSNFFCGLPLSFSIIGADEVDSVSTSIECILSYRSTHIKNSSRVFRGTLIELRFHAVANYRFLVEVIKFCGLQTQTMVKILQTLPQKLDLICKKTQYEIHPRYSRQTINQTDSLRLKLSAFSKNRFLDFLLIGRWFFCCLLASWRNFTGKFSWKLRRVKFLSCSCSVTPQRSGNIRSIHFLSISFSFLFINKKIEICWTSRKLLLIERHTKFNASHAKQI